MSYCCKNLWKSVDDDEMMVRDGAWTEASSNFKFSLDKSEEKQCIPDERFLVSRLWELNLLKFNDIQEDATRYRRW